jgi:hypothetical protein
MIIPNFPSLIAYMDVKQLYFPFFMRKFYSWTHTTSRWERVCRDHILLEPRLSLVSLSLYIYIILLDFRKKN